MSTTITATSTGATVEPLLILGYDTTQESRNIVHDLLDDEIALTLIAPRPRSGYMRLLFATHVDGFAALALHKLKTTFTVTASDRAELDMTYGTYGPTSLTLDEESGRWVLTVGYQEVS